MRADFVVLVLIERRGFAQNRGAHADLADVMKDRRDSHVENPLLIETAMPSREQFCEALDAVAVSGSVGVFGLNGSGMSPDRGDKDLFHLLFVMKNHVLLGALSLFEQALETRLIRFVLDQRFSTLHCAREAHFQFDKREWFAEKIEGARAHCSDGAGRV